MGRGGQGRGQGRGQQLRFTSSSFSSWTWVASSPRSQTLGFPSSRLSFLQGSDSLMPISSPQEGGGVL